MLDAGLVAERLRARHLLLKYNAFVPPTPPREHLPPLFDHRTNKDPTVDYFGPPERRQILAELFGLEGGAEEVKKLGVEIEPPFWCDYVSSGPFADVGCGADVRFYDRREPTSNSKDRSIASKLSKGPWRCQAFLHRDSGMQLQLPLPRLCTGKSRQSNLFKAFGLTGEIHPCR